MSGYEYPEDEFDAPGDEGVTPQGAHREPVPAWRGWLPLLAVIVLVPPLAWGAVSLLGGRSGGASAGASASPAPGTQSTAQATPSASPTASSKGDADLTTGVTVHNGTATSGLATRTGERLTNVGMTAVTVSQGSYSAAEPALTTVYYATPADEPTARLVAKTLGVSAVVESAGEAQSNPIVVVLRDDYTE